MNYALVLRDQGLIDQSLRQLIDLRDRFPDDPVIRYYLAISLAMSGRNDSAISELETCLKQKPDYGMARAVYGDLLQASRREAEGILQARSAVELSPGDLWVRIGLITLLQRCGKMEEAWKELAAAKTIIKPEQHAELAALKDLEATLRASSLDSPEKPK